MFPYLKSNKEILEIHFENYPLSNIGSKISFWKVFYDLSQAFSQKTFHHWGNLTSFVLCIKLGGCFEIFII